MGQRLGIVGAPNTGKSWSRRWIPDGERVVIIQPSVKRSYLFTGPAKAKEMTPEQLDNAVRIGKRVEIGNFDLKHPTGKWNNLMEARLAFKGSSPINLVPEPNYLKALVDNVKVQPGFFRPQDVKGNIMFCENVEDLSMYVAFVNKLMPWVHTIILPDFTHYITTTLTSDVFRNRTLGNDAYKKYLDLAAEGLKNFITSSNYLREELIVVTEFHSDEETSGDKLSTPGGKMLTEKFRPASYYDILLYTDVILPEDETERPDYHFITRKTRKFPEARSSDLYEFEELRIPNNLQEVLTKFRQRKNIEVKEYIQPTSN